MRFADIAWRLFVIAVFVALIIAIRIIQAGEPEVSMAVPAKVIGYEIQEAEQRARRQRVRDETDAMLRQLNEDLLALGLLIDERPLPAIRVVGDIHFRPKSCVVGDVYYDLNEPDDGHWVCWSTNRWSLSNDIPRHCECGPCWEGDSFWPLPYTDPGGRFSMDECGNLGIGTAPHE